MTLAYVMFIWIKVAPAVIVSVVIQSVLIAAVTVFGNELIQQAKRGTNRWLFGRAKGILYTTVANL